jgi:hypothetical protein
MVENDAVLFACSAKVEGQVKLTRDCDAFDSSYEQGTCYHTSCTRPTAIDEDNIKFNVLRCALPHCLHDFDMHKYHDFFPL